MYEERKLEQIIPAQSGFLAAWLEEDDKIITTPVLCWGLWRSEDSIIPYGVSGLGILGERQEEIDWVDDVRNFLGYVLPGQDPQDLFERFSIGPNRRIVDTTEPSDE